MSKLWTHADINRDADSKLLDSCRPSVGWCRGGAMHSNFKIVTTSTYGQRSSRHRYQKRKITKKNLVPQNEESEHKIAHKKKWKTAFERKKTQKKMMITIRTEKIKKGRTTELWGSRWSRRCKRREHKHCGGKKAKQGKYILMKKGEILRINRRILGSKINQQMEGGWSIMNYKW